MIEPKPEGFEDFDSFNNAWHDWAYEQVKHSPESLYFDGQYDDHPYVLWDNRKQ